MSTSSAIRLPTSVVRIVAPDIHCVQRRSAEESTAEEKERRKLEIDQACTARVARLKQDMEAEHKRRWQEVEKAIDGFLDDFEARATGQIVELAVRVAEAVVRRNLPDVDMLKSVIRETLDPIMDLHGVRVRLSSHDADLLAGSAPTGMERVEVVRDAGLDSGDVIVESRNGYFDATLSERLSLLGQHLKERSRDVHPDSKPA